MHRALFLALFGTLACGASDAIDEDEDEGESEPDRDCEERSGAYLFTYVERDGSCGPIPEDLVTFTEQPTELVEPCDGTISYSDDNCQVTTEATCPEPGVGLGLYSRTTTVSNWDESADRGTGVFSLRLFDLDDTLLCRGTYNITGVRQ
jgi:hypothetical protein